MNLKGVKKQLPKRENQVLKPGIARGPTPARDSWRMRLICITSRVTQIVQLLKIFPCHGV